MQHATNPAIKREFAATDGVDATPAEFGESSTKV